MNALRLRDIGYLIREKADIEGCAEITGYLSGNCDVYVPFSNKTGLKKELYLHDVKHELIFHIPYCNSELKKFQNTEGGPAMVMIQGYAEIWLADGGRVPALKHLIEA